MKTHQIKKSLAIGLLLLLAAVTATAQNVWKMEALNVKADETQTIQLALENTDSIVSLQFDLTLPLGVTTDLSKVTLNADRIDEHSFSKNLIFTNTYRFMVHSAVNKLLKGNTGTLISLPITIEKEFKTSTITLSNVVMTNKKAANLSYSTQLGVLSLVQKQPVVLSVSGLEQVVNKEKAATVTWTTIPANLILAGNVKYYTDATCATSADEAARKQAGTFYVTFEYAGTDTLQALKDTVTMIVNNKKSVDLTAKETELPTATKILQGQPLSSSILSGGMVLTSEGTPFPGTFAWTNGNQLATATGLYNITFVPNDNANYVAKDTAIKVTVTPIHQVFVSQPQNGSIAVKGMSNNNMYADGQTLTLSAIPAANYSFKEWFDGNKTQTDRVWIANKATTISAVFASITRKVTFSAGEGGTISVKAGNKTIASGDAVMQGTELGITVLPADGMKLLSLTLNNKAFTSGKAVVGEEDLSLKATFEKAKNEYPVNATATNGTIRLYKADGKTTIPSGIALKEGETFKVIPFANAGYELSALWINGEAADAPVDNVYTGTVGEEPAAVLATFSEIEYTLTTSQVGGTLDLTDGAGAALSNQVKYNSTVIIQKATPQDQTHRLSSVVANGRKIETFPASITVNGNLTISAKFEALTPIVDKYIINTLQQYTYNGQSKGFIIRTNQTHATDFTLTYKDEAGNLVAGKPIKGGEYDVLISRPADEVYAAYTSQGAFDKKLKVMPSKIAVTEAPTANEKDKKGKTTLYQDEVNVTVEIPDPTKSYLLKFIYGIADTDKDNYEETTYYLSTSDKKVTLNTHNMLRSAPNGYVRITNGGLPYDAEAEIPVGTKIEVEAIPNEGFKFVGWTNRSETAQSIEVEITENMSAEALNFIPKFEGKADLKPALASASSSYKPEVHTITLATSIEGAQISVFQDKDCTQPAELKNVGTYYIRVYRPATDEYNVVNATLTYTITQAKLDPAKIVAPTASEIAVGETLAQVQLLGGSAGDVPGTFSWETPATAVAKGDNVYKALFFSADPNYVLTTEVSVDVIGLSATTGGGTTDPPVDPTDPVDPVDPTDPETPTAIETIASETLIVVRDYALDIYPQMPVNISVISMSGKYLFSGNVETATRVQVSQPGVYIVSFMNDGKKTSRKIQVR